MPCTPIGYARWLRHIARNGWDGEWYLRAYFDDETPLGSAQDVESQIDALSKNWPVLFGAGDPVP